MKQIYMPLTMREVSAVLTLITDNPQIPKRFEADKRLLFLSRLKDVVDNVFYTPRSYGRFNFEFDCGLVYIFENGVPRASLHALLDYDQLVISLKCAIRTTDRFHAVKCAVPPTLRLVA